MDRNSIDPSDREKPINSPSDAGQSPPLISLETRSPPSATAPSFLAEPRSSPWDLFLYILFGFGIFLGLGLALRPVIDQRSISASILIYSINVVVFVGTVLVVGVLRKRLSLRTLGFLPPRWRWAFLGLAVAVTLVFLPIRLILALIVQLIVAGNLTSLANSARMQIITPSGFTWVSFLVTLVMAGFLAPVAEELFFRGAIYTWFRQRTSLWVAILASSGLFALGHADTLAVVVTSFILGAVNAWVFEKTRSLWASIAIHAFNNSLAVVLVYGAMAVSSVLK